MNEQTKRIRSKGREYLAPARQAVKVAGSGEEWISTKAQAPFHPLDQYEHIRHERG